MHGDTLNENFHSSAKRAQDGQYVELHQAPLLFRSNLSTRKLQVEAKGGAVKTLGTLRESAKLKGFSKLVDLATVYLTESGQQLLLQEVDACAEYKVLALTSISEVETIFKECIWRQASYARFNCLLKVVVADDKSFSGSFFKIQSKRTSLVDMIYVSPDGSYACTDPASAQMGHPTKDIIAIVSEGYFSINMKLHFDEIYWQPFVNNLTDTRPLNATIDQQFEDESVIRPSSEASESWSYDITLPLWNTILYGGEEMPHKLSVKERNMNVDNRHDRAKKMFRNLATMAQYDEDIQVQVETFYANLLAQQNLKAVRDVQARSGVLTGGAENIVVADYSTSRGKKRKTAKLSNSS